jgi:hypothetical protein
MNKKNIIVAIISALMVLIAIGGGIYLYNNKNIILGEKENLKKTEILGNKEDLVLFSVKAGDSIGGILNLTGTVKNAYFFEGNIIVDLLDSNQNIIKSGHGTATTEWMTTDPVFFTSGIDTTGLNGQGYILIQNDDPSDGESGRPAKKILIPVIFNNDNQKTLNVKVFFPNSRSWI